MNKSYLRWVGGKSRILTEVLECIGDCTNSRFIEPFMGSGTVSLNVEACEYLLNDFNPDLINAHKQVILYPDAVIEELTPMFDLGRDKYYEIRAMFNLRLGQTDIQRAALFIYLNRHGFQGLCRYSKKSGFNVPVGTGGIMDPTDLINKFSNYFTSFGYFNFDEVQCADYLHNCDFEEIIDLAGDYENDVVYCDSPYPSDNMSMSDFNYTKDGFGVKDHIRMRDAVVRASKRGVRVIVSLNDTEFVRELYSDADEIVELSAMRSISSKSKTRGKAKELLIIFNGKKIN